MLRVEHLAFRYRGGREVLTNVSFSLERVETPEVIE